MWDNTDKDYYVYAHYKGDSGLIFYVGISKRRRGSYHSLIYLRAYLCASSCRNKLWIRCYNKHNRTVKILYDNLTEKECKEKEIELISKFGRIIDKSGILCNLSAGGEGRFKDSSNNKRIYIYNLQGELIRTFPSCKEAAEYYGLERRNVGLVANMKRLSCGDLQFRYDYNKGINLIKTTKSPKKVAKPILCYNTASLLEIQFLSCYLFMKFLGLKTNSHILECLNGKRSNVKGWRVQYII